MLAEVVAVGETSGMTKRKIGVPRDGALAVPLSRHTQDTTDDTATHDTWQMAGSPEAVT